MMKFLLTPKGLFIMSVLSIILTVILYTNNPENGVFWFGVFFSTYFMVASAVRYILNEMAKEWDNKRDTKNLIRKG